MFTHDSLFNSIELLSMRVSCILCETSTKKPKELAEINNFSEGLTEDWTLNLSGPKPNALNNSATYPRGYQFSLFLNNLLKN